MTTTSDRKRTRRLSYIIPNNTTTTTTTTLLSLPPPSTTTATFHQKPAFTKTTTHHHTTQPKHPTHALPITTLAIDHTTPIRNPLNPQGILYAAGRDGLISAWELNQHKQASFRQAIQPHTHWINDLILCNQNQTIISASSDRTIKAWNPHSPQHALCPATIGTHLDYVKCLAHSPKAAWVASAGLDRTILLWDTNEARPNPLVRFSENLVGTSIYSLATTPAGQLLAAGSPAQAIALYDPRLATQLAKLVGHTDNVRAILLADDATRLLSASSDATVKMWDLRSQQRCLHTFAHHSTSVWALHSQHPALEIFYSADRAGWLCKLDLEGSDDFRDGQCIVLAHARQSRSHHQQGINSILAFDNFVWTASASSSIERWADIPTRIQRRQRASNLSQTDTGTEEATTGTAAATGTTTTTTAAAAAATGTTTTATTATGTTATAATTSAATTTNSKSLPLRSPQSVSFNFDTPIIQPSPNLSSPIHLDGIPLEALVPLFSQFDHLLPNADHQDPESITIHSPKSDASIPRRPSHHHIHSTMSSLSLRPPTHPGLEPVKLHSPLTIDASLHTPTLINPHPRPSITATPAWRLYTTRDSAAEAIPLRSSPVDLILGCSGLIKSELLNDCRHALTIDTSGRIALWDIISCTCQGIFDPDELERELDHGSSAGSSGSNYTPSELLKLVKERIEGQATIGTWCTVETQTGLLTVHLDEQRCFDGEVYADEAGLAEEVLELMKEDHRLCLGRWVLRNLFDGFINHHVQLRLRNENPTTPSAATDAANPGQTAESDEQQQNKKIYLPGRPSVPHTPGMTIALATPALTPAILPDLKTLTGPKNQQAADHSADYFSLPRLMEADEEQLGSEALTPGGGGGAGGGGGGGGLDSSTDASSSYTSSVYPLPSPRRASPVPVTTTQDGLPRDDKTPMTESPAASWSSTTSSAAAPPPPNSANIFSRFRSLGRGQKRRGSSDPAAPPVISNPIPYREDGDQAELDGQRLLMLEKAKAQQALVVQAVLAQPFEPCGPLDAPALMLPPDTTILVSEEEPQSGGWEVAYRGLVATTELDAEVLMDVLPGWILGFLLANRISNKEGGASTTTTTTTVKVTFVLQPEGGREAAGLPELPNGNARLTASRVLRMKKVAAYVAQKLDPAVGPTKAEENQQHPAPSSSSPSSSSCSKPRSDGPRSEGPKSHKPGSKSTGSAGSSSPSQHHHHHHHRHHHKGSEQGTLTPTSTSGPNPRLPAVDESLIVLSCNGQDLPRTLSLGVVKQWVWAQPGDVVICYRRQGLAPSA